MSNKQKLRKKKLKLMNIVLRKLNMKRRKNRLISSLRKNQRTSKKSKFIKIKSMKLMSQELKKSILRSHNLKKNKSKNYTQKKTKLNKKLTNPKSKNNPKKKIKLALINGQMNSNVLQHQ